MAVEKKAGAGRPSKWGKGDSDLKAIAKDIENFADLTPYYQQKLIARGFLEIVVTEKGNKFVDANV